MEETVLSATSALTTSAISGPVGAGFLENPDAFLLFVIVLVASLVMCAAATRGADAKSRDHHLPPRSKRLQRRLSGPRDRRL